MADAESIELELMSVQIGFGIDYFTAINGRI